MKNAFKPEVIARINQHRAYYEGYNAAANDKVRNTYPKRSVEFKRYQDGVEAYGRGDCTAN